MQIYVVVARVIHTEQAIHNNEIDVNLYPQGYIVSHQGYNNNDYESNSTSPDLGQQLTSTQYYRPVTGLSISSPPVSISPQVPHADELGLYETERAPARVQQRRRHDDVIKAGSDAPQRRLQQRRRPRVDVNAVIVVWAINGAQQTFYALDVTIDD